ncbi:MAG: zinc ribbon domain-containing protein [Anaerolineae bacterium]|nr:zinc ribbon domain-containing protein [Anaerolineae bacterium]
MPGFFDKIKSGADKAAFEADRLRRVTQAQGVLNKLKGELTEQVTVIGTRAVELYDGGTLAVPEMQDLFQQLDSLRQQVADQQEEIERIRQEKAPEAPVAAPAPAGLTCPNCHAEVAAGVKFCPNCGSKIEEPPAPATCPNCGAVVPPGSRFCPECGKTIAQE